MWIQATQCLTENSSQLFSGQLTGLDRVLLVDQQVPNPASPDPSPCQTTLSTAAKSQLPPIRWVSATKRAPVNPLSTSAVDTFSPGQDGRLRAEELMLSNCDPDEGS